MQLFLHTSHTLSLRCDERAAAVRRRTGALYHFFFRFLLFTSLRKNRNKSFRDVALKNLLSAAHAFLSLSPSAFSFFEMASRPVLEAFEAKRIALEVGSKKMELFSCWEKVKKSSIGAFKIEKTKTKKTDSQSPPTREATRASPARSRSGASCPPRRCCARTGPSTRTFSSRSR